MKKILFVIITILMLTSLLSVLAFAEAPEAVPSVREGQNLFEEIYSEVMKHSDKILSALSFVASLVIVFAYKKGLLPILKGALSKLSDTVSGLRESCKEANEGARTALSSAEEKLALAEKAVCELTEKLTSIEAELEASKGIGKSISKVEAVISSQVDMLYEIFMTSSLPLYQKEAVGEKISEMKKSLLCSGGESGDGEK